MGCLRAGAVLVVLEVVVILQACQDCMGLRQILSAGHSTSHGGSSIYSREESTQSPHQYETSPANLPDKGTLWSTGWFCADAEMDMNNLLSKLKSMLIKSNLYFWISQVLRTQLVHRDHPDSLLSKAYNTSSYSQRVVAAVKRSLACGDYFSGWLMSSKGGFESQVIPDERSVQYSTLTEYMMPVSIGTPPQQFCVFIDIGSDLFWLNYKPCNQCISHHCQQYANPQHQGHWPKDIIMGNNNSLE